MAELSWVWPSLSPVNDNITRPDWTGLGSAESENSPLCYSGGQKPRVKLQPRDSIYSPRLQTGKLNENNIMMMVPLHHQDWTRLTSNQPCQDYERLARVNITPNFHQSDCNGTSRNITTSQCQLLCLSYN